MANLTFFSAENGARELVKKVRENVDLVDKVANFGNSKSAGANQEAAKILKEAYASMLNSLGSKNQVAASSSLFKDAVKNKQSATEDDVIKNKQSATEDLDIQNSVSAKL
ncbi:MAG: hypothetical protein LCH30_11925 [Proteobacteria bacterium]|nr:hypothetical protein [Pseudomonadota bacterium]